MKKEIEKIHKAHKNLYNIFDLDIGSNYKECNNNIIRIIWFLKLFYPN